MEKLNPYEMTREELISVFEGMSRKREDNSITYPADVLPWVEEYASQEQEHFLVLLLDGGQCVIDTILATKGLVNRTLIAPREIFREAVKRNAVAVILVHNHPSGNLEPSPEDEQVTIRAKEAGEILGITVLDHVIVSGEKFWSFLEKGKL